MSGIQKPGHFLGRLALDAHGEAKSADFQIGHAGVKDLAKQIGGLLTRQGACAVLATTDFFDVMPNAHAVCQMRSWRS